MNLAKPIMVLYARTVWTPPLATGLAKDNSSGLTPGATLIPAPSNFIAAAKRQKTAHNEIAAHPRRPYTHRK
jgi:hypothetical protein